MLSVMAAAALTSIVPYDLRCENLSEPSGLDAGRPRLSWKLREARPGQRNLGQRRFRVLVASNPEILRREQGDLWDSGTVESSKTYGIPYAGRPLRSLQRCWWTVRCWDQADLPSDWSAPAHWSMGLLTKDDWKAKWISIGAPYDKGDRTFSESAWIWTPSDPELNAPAITRFFSKTFEVKNLSEVETAIFHLTADDKFVLKVNGTPVQGKPGEFEEWRRPAAIDVKSLLRQGTNKLDVEATNNSQGPAGVLGALILTSRDKTTTKVVTDGSWTAQDVPNGPELQAKILRPYGNDIWGSFDPPQIKAATYYRKAFDVRPHLKHATATITALGITDLYVNGKRVSEDLFTPGWTDYDKRVLYRCYDVTSLLTQGANCLGAILGEGWYSGYIGYGGGHHYYGDQPKVRVQLNLEFEDGSESVVATDETWRANTGPTTGESFLHGETYDARLEQPNWANGAFDDSKWQQPNVGPEIEGILEAYASQAVRPYKELTFKEAWKVGSKTWLVDFGQNLAGYAKLNLRQPRGSKIVLRFGERLTPDRKLYTENLRAARATDTYICKGGGPESWSPRFTFHGFQYVEITGLDRAPERDELQAIAISTATPETGWLETSNPMLNKLVSNAWWTQKMNFIDIPTDCPQRDERLGWTGDAQAYIRTATYYSDVQPFFNKWLVSLDDSQTDEGQYPMVAPLKVAGPDGGPAWADAGVICPWTTFEVYGDRELLARHYPQMKRFVEFNLKRSTADLLPPADIFGFDDWLNINAPTPRPVIAEAYFAGSTRLLSKAAAALGYAEDAQTYENLYQRIRKSFQKAYVAPDGVVAGDTQCSYVLALAFDLLEPEQEKQAAEHLVADIDRRGGHLSTGFVGTRDIMHVLSKIGRDDIAFRLLHNTTFPSWGFTIVNGATSIWERWDGWTPDRGFQDPGMNSFAHYAYGSVVGWMFAHIGGIQESLPGYDEVAIAPSIDPNLKWSRCHYDSLHGRIATEWERKDGTLRLKVTVPPNVRAIVRVPGTSPSSLEGMTPSEGAFTVGSGVWEFRSRMP